MVTLDDQLRSSSHPDLAHRSHECVFPGKGGFQRQRSGNECDLLMAQGGQVLYRLTNSIEIIDSNVADARARRTNVYENQGHVPKLQVVEARLFHAERHYPSSFNPALQP